MKQPRTRCVAMVVLVSALALTACDSRVTVKVDHAKKPAASQESSGSITVQDVTKPTTLNLVCPPEIASPTHLAFEFHGQVDGKVTFQGPGFRSTSGAGSRLGGRTRFSIRTNQYALQYIPSGVRKGSVRIDYAFE